MKKHYLKAFILLLIASTLTVGIAMRPLASATVPGVNKAIDVNTSGGNPNGNAVQLSISQDGRYVAFASKATNLISGTSLSGTYFEIFVRDRLSNTTNLVSISTGGNAANADSELPKISADGRYIVYESEAGNLSSSVVCSGSCGIYHIYAYDIISGTTSLVDTNSSGTVDLSANAVNPTVSADGRFVVFDSTSVNLVSSPTLNSSLNYDYIYEKDLTSGATKLLSIGTGATAPNGTSGSPYIDCGGDIVAFYSYASNLVSGDSNGKADAFIFNAIDNSVKDITISGDNDSAGIDAISCNGEYIGLHSFASNLTGSTISSSYFNAYEYDRINNTFKLVSQSSSGSLASGGNSYPVGVSNDGRVVAFNSSATNLVASDTNGDQDIFLRNVESGMTELIDVSSGGAQANGYIGNAAMSADGQYVGYISGATNLVSGFSRSGGATYVSQTGAAPSY